MRENTTTNTSEFTPKTGQTKTTGTNMETETTTTLANIEHVLCQLYMNANVSREEWCALVREAIKGRHEGMLNALRDDGLRDEMKAVLMKWFPL